MQQKTKTNAQIPRWCQVVLALGIPAQASPGPSPAQAWPKPGPAVGFFKTQFVFAGIGKIGSGHFSKTLNPKMKFSVHSERSYIKAIVIFYGLDVEIRSK